MLCLSDQSGGSGGFVLPGGSQDALRLVVPSQPVDPGLDHNEPELGVLILPVLLQMLADVDGLLDQVVDVLGKIGSQALGLQDSQDLVAGDEPDLGDTVAVPKDNTDLRGGQTLLGQLEDLFLDLSGAQLQPSWNGTAVREGTLGDTLAWCVHATHDDLLRK